YREYIHHSHQYHRPELVTGNGWREDLANVVNSNAPNAGGREIFPNAPDRGNAADDFWWRPSAYTGWRRAR
ncbi:hypothetical protein CAI21_18370, partial [Alkalilimnicola ehrlichii]